jgi:hypothetical protein
MRFSPSDAVVTGAVTVLSAALLVVFLNDLNAITSRGNETPMGTIFFKKQTATRRSPTAQIWERLRNQSPVYEADTLRTDSDSEAVVNFDDGLSLDMLQNSMLKLTTHGASTSLDFKEGSISLHGSDKGAPVALGQNGHTVSLSPDAQLVVTKSKDTMSLELSAGTASVTDASGKQQSITPETALDLNDQGAAVTREVDLIPQTPEQGAKLLFVGDGKMTVSFAYRVASKVTGPVEIQLSSAADFSDASPLPGPRGTAETPLEPGTWYWRVASGDAHSSTRQLSVSREEPLTLVQPQDGGDIAFRKLKPPVRFSWTASEHAVFWDLELSPTADFAKPTLRRRTTVSSLSIDGIPAGTWYWRVVPHYSGTLVSPVQVPPVSRFTVTQRPQMNPLAVTLPVQGTLVQTQELSTKGLAFTWDPPAEARTYELSVSKTPAGPAVAQFETSAPYKIVSPKELGTLAGVGPTYWSLKWADDEGSVSPAGPTRTIQAVDGELALRPTFPPDGYQVADQFLTNTRFAWKSNLSVRTALQVSRTPDFKDLVAELPVKADTALAGPWGQGTLYWRLSSYNVNGSVFLQTAPRRLEVVPPFPAVVLVQPHPGQQMLLPEQDDSTLVWTAVKGADYYQLTLMPAGGRSQFQATVERPTSDEVKLVVPLGRFAEGSYVARVQAFARETLTSTSVIGLYGDSPFAFRRITRMKLISPPDKTSIDGLTAHRGLTLVWGSANLPPNAQVRISGFPGGGVKRFAMTAVEPVRLTSVPAGDYTWTVEGSLETFDISAPKAFHFTVQPIPKLPAAVTLSPADKTVYGPKDLRQLKALEFRWQPVAGAQQYLFTLTPDSASAKPVLELVSADPRAVLDKMSLLHQGSYVWRVEATTVDAQGQVEREGIVAESRFSIDLPSLGKPKLSQGQAFYGN